MGANCEEIIADKMEYGRKLFSVAAHWVIPETIAINS
jgi:hypothetical protein